ncbi:hypothetical protein KP509_08G035200 [Ceratopteris richardii]|uniref:VQ domain-containing protein n=1 Tax=Ceratopteris richardii TaxID=49495 RepID=A0A8T2U5W1_CERRI|nr:hypothetical protein KP509_08G035200 [Ceratopteris richardii]
MDGRIRRLERTLPIVRVVEEEAPIIVYSDVANFQSVVQNLTGWNTRFGNTPRESPAHAQDQPGSSKENLIIEDDLRDPVNSNPLSTEKISRKLDALIEVSSTFSGKQNYSSMTSDHFPKNEIQVFSQEVNHELYNLKTPFECWELSKGHFGCAMEDVTVKDIKQCPSTQADTSCNSEYSYPNVHGGEDNLAVRQHNPADDDIMQDIMSLITNNEENQEMWTLPGILSDDQDFIYSDANLSSQLEYLAENLLMSEWTVPELQYRATKDFTKFY